MADTGVKDKFEAIIISADLRLRKPNPKIFQRMLAMLNLTAPEVLFVGDTPHHDVGGAKAVGMSAAWISRHALPLPARRRATRLHHSRSRGTAGRAGESLMARALVITVIGAGDAPEEVCAMAREVGREIASRGAVLINGGRGGVMRAAAEGARSAGGHSIGIIPELRSRQRQRIHRIRHRDRDGRGAQCDHRRQLRCGHRDGRRRRNARGNWLREKIWPPHRRAQVVARDRRSRARDHSARSSRPRDETRGALRAEANPINPEQKLAMASLERAPFSALLGLKIISAENGVAVVRMPFSEKLLNDGGPGVPIHGGAIASLADFAACAAIWSLEATQRSATISMTVNYTGPGHPIRPRRARTWCDARQTRREYQRGNSRSLRRAGRRRAGHLQNRLNFS